MMIVELLKSCFPSPLLLNELVTPPTLLTSDLVNINQISKLLAIELGIQKASNFYNDNVFYNIVTITKFVFFFFNFNFFSSVDSHTYRCNPQNLFRQ